ncbi:hypothetical protein AUEXF2481DRAFT_470002 [Aureobasidium subglaciale EXF-2481]|uniref:BTB domain-containing protein n=1 Tax=Aureobasidium subglaciale (strain EXF-2481) TaxID=1043005 RepID=A0A074YK35_AURSE|nr:uncharacterized protein AUEXF2481DRAFT_470002 [Aureobasidium subglaciale EXF-2481]KEQ98133.1 hypothetical protein AUEXF2481DRAFT_470002 [Aureobasidium subglaciale EXF-2481]
MKPGCGDRTPVTQQGNRDQHKSRDSISFPIIDFPPANTLFENEKPSETVATSSANRHAKEDHRICDQSRTTTLLQQQFLTQRPYPLWPLWRNENIRPWKLLAARVRGSRVFRNEFKEGSPFTTVDDYTMEGHDDEIVQVMLRYIYGMTYADPFV